MSDFFPESCRLRVGTSVPTAACERLPVNLTPSSRRFLPTRNTPAAAVPRVFFLGSSSCLPAPQTYPPTQTKVISDVDLCAVSFDDTGVIRSYAYGLMVEVVYAIEDLVSDRCASPPLLL